MGISMSSYKQKNIQKRLRCTQSGRMKTYLAKFPSNGSAQVLKQKKMQDHWGSLRSYEGSSKGFWQDIWTKYFKILVCNIKILNILNQYLLVSWLRSLIRSSWRLIHLSLTVSLSTQVTNGYPRIWARIGSLRDNLSPSLRFRVTCNFWGDRQINFYSNFFLRSYRQANKNIFFTWSL